MKQTMNVEFQNSKCLRSKPKFQRGALNKTKFFWGIVVAIAIEYEIYFLSKIYIDSTPLSLIQLLTSVRTMVYIFLGQV